MFTICLMGLASALLLADSPYDCIDLGPDTYWSVLLLPNQIATCDCIFAGTVVTNISEKHSVFSVDETLFGPAITTNITVQSISDFEAVPLKQSSKYLVFAYTNNWGYFNDSGDAYFVSTLQSIRGQIMTNRPPLYGVFDGYRILTPGKSAIEFSTFVENGTNYWDYYRTFVTNNIEILKIKHDTDLCFKEIRALIRGKRCYEVPKWLKRELIRYDFIETLEREELKKWLNLKNSEKTD